MTDKKEILIKGNIALAESAIRAGCRYYFGYPITPQNEVSAYLSKRLPEENGVFIQAESEVAAINMVFGASAAGANVLTSSSSPGISLKQEGISYMVGCQLPAVIVNVQRAGPGLGGIGPAQGDYFQATKGGGHGDMSMIVLAPSSVQEIIDLMYISFELADKYRNPVMLLLEGVLGQMMEEVVLPEYKETSLKEDEWVLKGIRDKKEKSIIRSYYASTARLEKENINLQKKYNLIRENEIRYEFIGDEKPDILLIGFGIIGRILGKTRLLLLEKGIKASIFRPISLFPFPYKQLQNYTDNCDLIMVSELNMGQMIQDVKVACYPDKNILFYNKLGGFIPTAEEIFKYIVGKIS